MKLKIRAWCKNRKIIIDWETLLHASPHGEYLHRVLTDDQYEYMLWTGLNDRRGKEIYEGDVVERVVEFSVAVGELLDLKHTKEVGVIKWDFNRWVVKDWGFVPGHWEVIGNIWENPELLGTN